MQIWDSYCYAGMVIQSLDVKNVKKLSVIYLLIKN